MKAYKWVAVGVAFFAAAAFAQPPAKDKDRVGLDDKSRDGLLIVVDRSGSMEAEFPSIKANVGQLLGALPKNQATGLVHFAGCEDNDVVYSPKLGTNNHDTILAVIGKMQAGGGTALAKALAYVHKAMEDGTYCPRLVIFTDYYETCGGNPQAVVEKTEKFCMEINVITQSTSEEVIKNFTKLTRKTGGLIKVAETQEEVNEALKEISQRGKTGKQAFSTSSAKKETTKTDGEKEPEKKTDDPKAREKAKAKAEAEQKKEKGGNP